MSHRCINRGGLAQRPGAEPDPHGCGASQRPAGDAKNDLPPVSTVALTSASISLPLRGCRAFEQFSLRKKFAFRRFTPTHHGGSEALLVGTHCPATGEFRLTITAATVRPIQLRFEKKVPAAEELRRAIDDSLPFDTYCERTIFTVPHALHPSPF